MKTIKSTFIAVLLLVFTFNLSHTQAKRYNVHVDYVKPSKIGEYEKIAKEFNDASKKHNIQTSWLAVATSDLRYMYVSPIENFADLDKRPMADMAKAMGDSFGNMFEQFDK